MLNNGLDTKLKVTEKSAGYICNKLRMNPTNWSRPQRVLTAPFYRGG